MTDARNFLLNSDYPLDKIVFLTSGSFTVPNGTFDLLPSVNIAHGLPFIPLPILQWSNTADFVITNEDSDEDSTKAAFGSPAGQTYRVSGDATNVNILKYNFSGSDQTVYYRIFCFAPSDADIDSEVVSTSSLADTFVLNTDYNYMKLAYSGILTAGTPPNSVSFTHNLGFVPRVQLWSQNGAITGRIITSQEYSTDTDGSAGITTCLYITDTDLIWLNTATYEKIHYRIYADE